MYAELVFSEHITAATDDDISLYEVIPSNKELQRDEKKYVSQLEVSSTIQLYNTCPQATPVFCCCTLLCDKYVVAEYILVSLSRFYTLFY